jgi:hypothetical protein
MKNFVRFFYPFFRALVAGDCGLCYSALCEGAVRIFILCGL